VAAGENSYIYYLISNYVEKKQKKETSIQDIGLNLLLKTPFIHNCYQLVGENARQNIN